MADEKRDEMNEKRNMANSAVQIMHMPQANWTNWSVVNAVKEGYTASGWVYRAVSMIAKNGASVPWVVKDVSGDIVEGHPLTKVLNRPNTYFSRQDFFELLLAWQQLTGQGFAKKVIVQGKTTELWPVSPDRLAPFPSKDAGKLIDGYELIDANGQKKKTTDYDESNTIHFKLLDPSNPLQGLGPLQAVARAVDIDVEQQKWNKSAMQNRGVLDGIFSFDRDLDLNGYNLVKKMIKDMISSSKRAREPGVIGSNAKYQQLSLTPVEMDFLNSRKFNREEIFIIFGVPPQLAGVQDSSTYNNYSTSMRIFWETTILPALDDLADTFNMSFQNELSDNLVIAYDTTGIAALKDNEDGKSKIAKTYFDMGVPVEKLNAKFGLNIEEYEGWEKPWGGAKPTVVGTAGGASEVKEEGRKKFELLSMERRNIDDEIEKNEKLAQKASKDIIAPFLKVQQAMVFKALTDGVDIHQAMEDSRPEAIVALTDIFVNTANVFAGSVIVDSRGHTIDFETRGVDPVIDNLIKEFLQDEAWILTELSLIEASTVQSILDIVVAGELEGSSINTIKQAIADSGIFSPERSLRIARTVTGTAQSVGQMAGAIEAGATKKTWVDSGFEVRAEHVARNGETVGLQEKFSSQFPGYAAPRWPLDQNIAPADRINCRCSLTFEM